MCQQQTSFSHFIFKSTLFWNLSVLPSVRNDSYSLAVNDCSLKKIILSFFLTYYQGNWRLERWDQLPKVLSARGCGTCDLCSLCHIAFSVHEGKIIKSVLIENLFAPLKRLRWNFSALVKAFPVVPVTFSPMQACLAANLLILTYVTKQLGRKFPPVIHLIFYYKQQEEIRLYFQLFPWKFP